MIERRHKRAIMRSLAEAPAVVLAGPRQVGNTTLARDIAQDFPDCVYLDLEDPYHAARLVNPGLYFDAHPETVVVLDEIQRMLNLFQVLRGHIAKRRRRGQRNGQFLLLGSASNALLRQSAESLAGRVVYHELPGLDALETGEKSDRLWTRGGFPDAFRAVDDEMSPRWRTNFVRTFLERDIPQLGVRVSSVTLRRFWTMLGHYQGGVLNASALARSLAPIDHETADGLDLHLVCDTYATHKHATVRPWVAMRPCIHLHFIPTSASWLNQIERWFGLLGERTVQHATFHSVTEFKQRIMEFT